MSHSLRRMAAGWTSAVLSRAPKLTPVQGLPSVAVYPPGLWGVAATYSGLEEDFCLTKITAQPLRQGGEIPRFPAVPSIPLLCCSKNRQLCSSSLTPKPKHLSKLWIHLHPITSSPPLVESLPWNHTVLPEGLTSTTPVLTGSDHPNHNNHLFATYKALM